MSKLYAKVETERTRKAKTVPANKEIRIRVNYGSAENSMPAYDLLISEREGNFPFLDIQTTSKFHVIVNGKSIEKLQEEAVEEATGLVRNPLAGSA